MQNILDAWYSLYMFKVYMLRLAIELYIKVLRDDVKDVKG